MVETWTPYAQAIFEIARDTGKEEKYMSDLESLSSIWQQEKDFVLALSHPKIAKATKKTWLLNLFEDLLDATMMQTLLVFNEHDVIANLPQIYQAYLMCYRDAHDIEIIKVESASELDAKQKSSLKQMLETKLNKTVELDIAIKPELIAGMKVCTRDMVLDNTVLSRLEAIKEKISG